MTLASWLGAGSVAGWSGAERDLAARAGERGPGSIRAVTAARDRIRAGEDPLGDAFCALRSPAGRRVLGQTFTPLPVIESMIAWAAGTGIRPARVVDPGSGSARMLLAAGRRWPQAALIGVEIDPAAAIIGRASLAAAGFAGRSAVLLGDYCCARLPHAEGPTLFLGNPPYVRHHQIAAQGKDWLRRAAREQGLPASGLAGLHAHFFLATARHAALGDLGVLITAAEWLDVNYGRLVRELLLGALGGQAVHLIDPATAVFADAAATSVIACFRPGTTPEVIRMRRVAGPAELGALTGGTPVAVPVLRATSRWGPLLRAAEPEAAEPDAARPGSAGPRRPGRLREGHIELGELCRVHRGQVTGANAVWVTAGPHLLVPARFLIPAVTRARELIAAGPVLAPGVPLRQVISLPADLDELPGGERAGVARFLRLATAAGAADSYVARHRTPWWRVRLGVPPPIMASYMGRRPPVFVRNQAGASYLNIAHGLYPREPLDPGVLDALAAFLSRSVSPEQGRVYAGGLIKFEPREMERLLVPGPALLAAEPAVHATEPALLAAGTAPLPAGAGQER
jgi:adenine-specific DNA-methyltransferase